MLQRLTRILALVVVAAVCAMPMHGTATAAPPVGSGGWEMQNPVYQSPEYLNALWGTSASDIFAVGDAGTVIHYDGSTWVPMNSGTASNLSAVWGTSRCDVFAVGDSGTIIHYDGGAWTVMASGSDADLRSIWGTSSADIFAVGGIEIVLHYDGMNWSTMPFPGQGWNDCELNDIWGCSSSEIYAVGTMYPCVFRYDGSSWSGIHVDMVSDLEAVWGTSSSDIFVGSVSSFIRHYDGSTWTSQNTYAGDELNAFWGSSASDVFAVSRRGTIAHYDGNAWSRMVSGTEWQLNSVWGSSSRDVFAVGDARVILHYDGQSWTPMGGATASDLGGVWSTGEDDVFAVGAYGTIVHYDGASWTAMPSGTTANLEDVWGSSPSDVFAVGWSYKTTTTFGSEWGDVLHYDGNTWTAMTIQVPNEKLCGVWGSSPSDVFAIGRSGTILHYDGSSWTIMTTASALLPAVTAKDWTGETVITDYTAHLWKVCGTSSSNVFAIGTDFRPSSQALETHFWEGPTELLVLHYDGHTWNVSLREQRPTLGYDESGDFSCGVWCSSPSDVFALVTRRYEDYCSIERFDGIGWATIDTSYVGLRDLWGASPSNLFCVGSRGTIRHFDGSNWSNMESGTSAGLNSVWGDSQSVYAVGEMGTILRYDCPQPDEETPADADSNSPNGDRAVPTWVWVMTAFAASAVLVGAPAAYILGRSKYSRKEERER